jgi:Hyaluronidase
MTTNRSQHSLALRHWSVVTAVLLVLALLAPWAGATEVCGPEFNNVRSGGTRGFALYEGLIYKGLPDLSGLGIKRVRIIDRGIWTPAGIDAAPDPALVAQVAKTIPNDDTPVVLDFESYPMTGSAAAVADSVAKLNRIAADFRAQVPGRSFGHYGMPPIRDYWRAISKDRTGPQMRAWQADNTRLASLEADVDVLFPSIYTFYDDRDGWRRYAIAQICEARRISKKPVIVFLWPEFHPSNTTTRDRFIDADFWRMQLDLASRYADGVVLWGGYDLAKKVPRDWDENAPWWVATKAFAKSIAGRK